MSLGLAEPSKWPRRRWWNALALVFAAQLGIIFWLGDTKPFRPGATKPGPALLLPKQIADDLNSGSSSDTNVFALVDPTLFALPHRQSFSGSAWLSSPTQEFHPFVWSESPRWLGLSAEKLGAVFHEYVNTSQASPLLTLIQPEPQLLMPEIPAANDFPSRSTYRVTGQLAERHLLTPVELPSWPSQEILTNSRVQMVVDADGKPVSVALLYPGSGSKEADTNALWQAANARFAPKVSGNPGPAGTPFLDLSWGQMVFEWHTLPKPATNVTSEGKKP
jgi:hypothetical protein